MKFKSCHWISHGLNFEPEHIEMCCLRCHVGGGNLFVKRPYHGEPVDWDEIFELKKAYVEENKRGIINPKCEGCFNISENEWKEDEHYFTYLHFNHWTHCNCNCIYCFTEDNKKFYNESRYYSVLPIVKDLFEKKLFRPGGEITFAGGEPTILDEFEDLINLLLDNNAERIIIHTSGIKYSPALARGIKKGVIDVVVSLDSGCEATFKTIKGINAYKKVVDNLKLYVQAEDKDNKPMVQTKYIMIPEVNDNIYEAEKWLEVSYDTGVRSVVIDIEHVWYKNQREISAFPKYARDIISYIHQRADELGMFVVLYNSARYFMENEQNFPNYEFVPYRYKALFERENTSPCGEHKICKNNLLKILQKNYQEFFKKLKSQCSKLPNILKK